MDRPTQGGILIIGAGLAGLTLALALARSGVKSTVVEKQEEITPSKWAILLYPFGMKIFDELGVLEDLTKLGIPLKPPEVVTSKGESLAVIDTGLLSEPRLSYSLLLGPSEIRKVLRERALTLGVELLEGYKFKDLVRDPASLKIVGAAVEKDGEVVQLHSKVVVGADGYKSKVREQFGVRTKERTYPTVAAFFLEHEHGFDHMKMILGKGSQMVVLPCTKTRLNLGYTEDGLTISRLERPGGLEYVLDKMSESAPYLKEAIQRERNGAARETALFIEPKVIHVDSWVVERGVLIGDAAHSYHPGTGLGAQAAFMDAAVLAPILAKCAADDDFSLSRLNRFEAERRPLVNFQEATNTRTMSMELSKSRTGIWLRNRSFRAAAKLIHKREYQEILTGIRPPTRGETLKLLARTFLP
ncbi:MAG: FAD-dependent monooxygenase [Thaumarchaeota archaeon]|nr:FAD-dependent monooxygenase [Nitrososphaerota archaeon]